jgi:hypothetical protein
MKMLAGSECIFIFCVWYKSIYEEGCSMAMECLEAFESLKRSFPLLDNKELKNFLVPHKKCNSRATEFTKKAFSSSSVLNAKMSYIAEAALASTYYTGVTTPYLKHVLWLSKKLNAYQKFIDKVRDLKPPEIDRVTIPTSNSGYNHLASFVIKDGIIWRKYHDAKGVWEPMYFDGFEDGTVPVFLDVDGANLIVIDDLDEVHYKKTMTEWRDELGEYHYIDKTLRDNWKPEWFTFPYLRPIYNAFAHKRLKLPAGWKAFAVSHRGQYAYYYLDAKQQKQFDKVGTSTFFLLAADGRTILIADPWLPFGFNHYMPCPADKTFVADNLHAAASTVFLIGRGVKTVVEEGKTIHKKTVKLFTRFADFDTTGQNPLRKYSYTRSDDTSVIHLPAEDWVEHDIELTGKARLSKIIWIEQTGMGNNARRLNVVGTNAKGEIGYYTKSIEEKSPDAWKFIPTHFDVKDKEWYPEDERIESHLEDPYMEKKVSGHAVMQNTKLQATMKSFYHTTHHAELELQLNQKTVKLKLFKQPSILSVLGPMKPGYKLVCPKKTIKNEDKDDLDRFMKGLFSGKRVSDVYITENQSHISISNGRLFATRAFKFSK